MFLRTWLLRRFLIVPVICMGHMTLGACAAARSAAPSVTITTTETVVITPSPPPSSALPTPAAPNPTSGPALQTAKSNTTPAAPASVAPEVFVMPRFSGQNLQLAQDTLQSLGSYLMDQQDAAGLGRLQVIDSNWKVCSQDPKAGEKVPVDTMVILRSVKLDEKCP